MVVLVEKETVDEEEGLIVSLTMERISPAVPNEKSDLNSSSCELYETSDAFELMDGHVASASSPTVDSTVTYEVDSSSLKRDSDPPDKDIYPLESADVIQGPPSAKDGGYGWVVLVLVFIINTVLAGNIKSFGITYTLILDYFPDASGASSGWIMGLLIGCRCLLSPVMGALTVKIGPRKCVILGTFICAGSFLLAVPAYSIAYMAFTLGALFGSGMGMAETPGFIIITDYFEKRRSLANGIRAAGNPLGGVLFSPMIVLLQQHFGLRGAFIMMAGVLLQLVVLGMLMRPFNQHKRLVEDRYWRKQLQNNSSSDLQIKSLKDQHGREEQIKKKKKPLDFTFFKNPAYLVYLFVIISSSAAMPNALLYMPMYGRTMGLSDMQNSFVSSYCSFCDFAMRLACGLIFSKGTFKKTHGFIAGLLVGAVGCFMVPLCKVMWQLIIAATLFSLCMGFFWALINTLLADQFGGDSMPSTWGFFRMTQGICGFVYPSFIGFVMDVSGGMTMPYILMGSLLILAASIFAMQPLIAKLPGSTINFS